ncbi:hypothetical protein BDR05DRAFT_964824 [Suillus weaverae]|nr:hypothetical protein BDR05DRAFT_964824 [Suillus weaverae]
MPSLRPRFCREILMCRDRQSSEHLAQMTRETFDFLDCTTNVNSSSSRFLLSRCWIITVLVAADSSSSPRSSSTSQGGHSYMHGWTMHG